MGLSRDSTLILYFAVFSTLVLAENNSIYTNGVSGNRSVVFLDDNAAFGVCVYPASGTYSFLNRLLYYCTLIFSLFSRAHLWLVAGALAAALTYSGSAAVHACLLVWRGPNPYIENDSWVLYSILSSACLITVPLLNWSGTLRRLGAKASSIRDPHGTHTQSDVSTRTIVVYWAFLVLVGYISIWVQVIQGADDTNQEYPVMSKVMCSNPLTNGSMLMSSNGTFHRRAIDSQFIQDNGCTDPCNQINIPSIFRQQGDLILMNHQQSLLWNSTLPGGGYQFAEKVLTYEDKLFDLDFNLLPFILIQGIIAALFGRRDPREIRDLLYIKLSMKHPLSQRPFLRRTQDYLVRLLAAFNYILAVAVVLLCPPLFIVGLVSSELQYWNLQPDAEAPYAVGQWEPWAVTVQVLLAVLIARYHDKAISFICGAYRRVFPSPRKENGWAVHNNAHSDHELGNIKSEANKPDIQINNSDIPSTTPDPEPLSHRIRSTIIHAYKMVAHPLNQSDRGLFDEIRNFFQWCKDPQAVSRLVIRHPLRPRDRREVEEAEGKSEKHVTSPPIDGDEAQSPDLGRLSEKGRLDSGFFRGAAMENR